MKKVVLVFGGKSAEHEVSIKSARNIAAAMDKNLFQLILVGISVQGSWYRLPDLKSIEALKSLNDLQLPATARDCAIILKNGQPHLLDLETRLTELVDCAFPINHGTYGEDGCIQGYFQMMNLPFVGCDVLSSSISLNKEAMKKVFRVAQIPHAKFIAIKRNEPVSYSDLVEKLGTPFFIKPASMGSSVGVHKINSFATFETKLKESFQYDHVVLAEEFIDAREIECTVIGTRLEARASVCGELIPNDEFYSYEAKYADSRTVVTIPAQVSAETHRMLQQMAIQVFHAMSCEGLARVDFFLTPNGEILVNELNTLPGFTDSSLFPMLWEKSGVPYTELVTKVIQFAFDKFIMNRELKTVYLDFQNESERMIAKGI